MKTVHTMMAVVVALVTGSLFFALSCRGERAKVRQMPAASTETWRGVGSSCSR